MSKFKRNSFEILDEPKKKEEFTVINLDTVKTPVIKSFEIESIKKAGEGEYQTVKAKYGPLATTDTERSSRSQKDSRFSLNSLLRDPLSVEQEERRVMEEKVRTQVEALAESAKSAGIERGYQEGLKKGFDQSIENMKVEGAATLKTLDRLVAEFENAKSEIYHANERFLIELVYRIARSVVLREVNIDKDYLLRLAKTLVDRVGVRDNLVLRVNAQDLDSIEKMRNGLEKGFGKLTNLTIEPSDGVERGGCQIETEWNSVDANIDVQLKGIHDSLVGANPGDPS